MQSNNEEQKISEGENITTLAEVLLTNLPNSSDITAGFRRYDGELVMLCEKHDGKQIIVPVKAILEYLSKKYGKKNETLKEIVESVGLLFEDIWEDTKYQPRMFGFDGVCHYLYNKIDTQKTHIFDETDERLAKIEEEKLQNRSRYLSYYIKHPLVDGYEELKELINKYNNAKTIYDRQEAKENVVKFYRTHVVDRINTEIGKSKYCNGCTYNIPRCDFCNSSIESENHRRPSFDYDGSFKNFHQWNSKPMVDAQSARKEQISNKRRMNY